MLIKPVYATEPIKQFAPATLFPDLATLVNLAMQLLTVVGGMLIIAVFVYGTIRYLTSNGNPEEIQKAQRFYLYAVIGFVVVLFAYTFSRVFINALGAPDPFTP